MAIKERKQITGTTEQINAYAGHEGQIVWDKDKKTFVGMSGTAGTNYPLAQQAYVDSQFLPLTGGNMAGELIFNNLGSIVQETSPEHENVMFHSYDRANQWLGGFLSCRGHSGSVETERGSFVLGARSKDGTSSGVLLGTPAGDLSWQGNEVLRITGAGDGWIRFNPNLQICFGVGRTESEGSATLSFGAPFSRAVSINATIFSGLSATGVNWACLVQTDNGNFFNAYTFGNGALKPYVSFSWCALGYY